MKLCRTRAARLAAALLIAPVALILVAENLGHLKAVGAMTGRDIDRDMGRAFMGDGLATMLSGQRSYEALPRGQSIGWEPGNRWTQPSLVVMGEANYSDAHLFPWVYRHLGIGKLLGMPVAGTGTAVWWETLQDGAVYFGIPEVGFRDDKGEFMDALAELELGEALLKAGMILVTTVGGASGPLYGSLLMGIGKGLKAGFVERAHQGRTLLAVDPWGVVLGEAAAKSGAGDQGFDLIAVEIDAEAVTKARQAIPLARSRTVRSITL